MRQTLDWQGAEPLNKEKFSNLLTEQINNLDIDRTRKEVEPFVKIPENLFIWSHEFFLNVASRIEII